MSIVTLGMKSEEQILDGLDTEESKRYMHQYNFPGYSVGEAKSSRGPGRREIGHGALAEKALVPASINRRISIFNKSSIRNIKFKWIYITRKYLCFNISFNGCWCSN